MRKSRYCSYVSFEVRRASAGFLPNGTGSVPKSVRSGVGCAISCSGIVVAWDFETGAGRGLTHVEGPIFGRDTKNTISILWISLVGWLLYIRRCTADSRCYFKATVMARTARSEVFDNKETNCIFTECTAAPGRLLAELRSTSGLQAVLCRGVDHIHF
jgi:hypothetical protein